MKAAVQHSEYTMQIYQQIDIALIARYNDYEGSNEALKPWVH